MISRGMSEFARSRPAHPPPGWVNVDVGLRNPPAEARHFALTFAGRLVRISSWKASLMCRTTRI